MRGIILSLQCGYYIICKKLFPFFFLFFFLFIHHIGLLLYSWSDHVEFFVFFSSHSHTVLYVEFRSSSNYRYWAYLSSSIDIAKIQFQLILGSTEEVAYVNDEIFSWRGHPSFCARPRFLWNIWRLMLFVW